MRWVTTKEKTTQKNPEKMGKASNQYTRKYQWKAREGNSGEIWGKRYKEIEDLNNIVNQLDLTGIYSITHTKLHTEHIVGWVKYVRTQNKSQ